MVLNITEADQAWERFLNGEGELAVVPAGRYWLEADESVAAAPIPTRDGRPLTIARGWAVAMVTEDPARQMLALMLLEWLIAPDYNARWTQAAGYLPGTRSALRLWEVSREERAVLRGLLEAALPPPQPEVMAVVGPAMQDALKAVLRGRATPEEAVDAARERITE